MIRVQYDGGAGGPYKHQLTETNSPSGVNVYQIPPSGTLRLLVVEAYHRIGNDRITNRWIFRGDGVVLPEIYRAGLQHDANHRHHVYCRFDFDLDDPNDDLTFWRTDSWPQDWGWGPAWWPVDTEQAITRDARDPYWAVMDTQTQRGYFVLPGPFDGRADSFCRHDLWVTRYHVSGNRLGSLGKATEDQLLTLLTGESTHGADLVLWYCAHLSHQADDHGAEWHVCGPILRPFRFDWLRCL